jgi:Holliday junction resolvasome RuvABC ATP-dependent DNA helicase subunit
MRSAKDGKLPRHMLALTGAGGLGKTSLALAVAKEVDCAGVIIVPAKPVRAEVDWIMATIDDGMMLLLDELHSYANQTWLLDTLEGARGIGRSVDFFAFGATTNRGALPQTVFSRFPVRLDISYSDEELARIADQVASRFGITLDNHGREVLLRAAVGNPRTMRNILGFWDAGPEEAVQMAQLTRDGLDDVGAARCWSTWPSTQRPIGRATLARVLEAPGGLADVEAVLIRRRYIKPTPSGLVIEHAGAEARLDPARERASEMTNDADPGQGRRHRRRDRPDRLGGRAAHQRGRPARRGLAHPHDQPGRRRHGAARRGPHHDPDRLRRRTSSLPPAPTRPSRSTTTRPRSTTTSSTSGWATTATRWTADGQRPTLRGLG